MNWNKYTVTTSNELVDLIVDLLSELGISGVMIEDNIPLTEEEKKQMYVDILPNKVENDGKSHISFYLECDDNEINSSYYNTGVDIIDSSPKNEEEFFRNFFSSIDKIKKFIDIGDISITKSNIRSEDWENKWKDFFKPFKIGEKIIISPSWIETEVSSEEILVNIDPGIAFGTGNHETTKLCAIELERYLRPNSRVLDIGCGSAILTIIALKLGAVFGYAIDIDSVAISVAEENLSQNNIPKASYKLEVKNLLEDSTFPVGLNKFNLIVANILAPVLIPLSSIISSLLEDDGIYICSGIIIEAFEDVKKSIEDANLKIISETVENDWVCIVARK